LPLALELAAARARILPLSAILERLDEWLAFLTGGALDLPERQRTLAATIDWSYALLDDEERETFTALSVFVDGASLAAVERVASRPGRALDVLTSLCDQSLVLSRATEDGEPRFRMLATIREYAHSRLDEAGREEEVRRRHAAWFLQVAEEAEPELQGRRQAHVLRQLTLEHDNLRAALSFAAETDDGETLVRLAAALWRFWFARGHLTEGRSWLARALLVEGLPPDARARALRGASVLAAVAGELGHARAAATELVELRQSLGNDHAIAEALVVLANVEAAQGEQDGAAARYEEAAAHARRAGARPALAGIMNNLGYLSLLRGQPETARETCREAASLFEELGFGEEAAGAWLNAASAEIGVGDLNAARAALAESLDRYVVVQHSEGLAYVLETAAAIAARAGAARRAAVLIGAAAAARARTGGSLPPLEQRLHDETAVIVETSLGGLATSIEAEGAALTLESALDLAYKEVGDTAADQ
jgi:non-specific serine/threonine protein kinase